MEMRKSELIQKMIKIEEQSEFRSKITMDYLAYLQMQKRLVEIGDVELK